jgi:hypothetical protein
VVARTAACRVAGGLVALEDDGRADAVAGRGNRREQRPWQENHHQDPAPPGLAKCAPGAPPSQRLKGCLVPDGKAPAFVNQGLLPRPTQNGNNMRVTWDKHRAAQEARPVEARPKLRGGIRTSPPRRATHEASAAFSQWACRHILPTRRAGKPHSADPQT